MHQLKTYLSENYLPNSNNGHGLCFDHEIIVGFVFPAKVFSGELKLDIGGVKLMYFDVPGETENQIIIWQPEQKVLFCTDNCYPAFPNLYTIRGIDPHPIRDWIETSDWIRDPGVEYHLPSHTEPVN